MNIIIFENYINLKIPKQMHLIQMTFCQHLAYRHTELDKQSMKVWQKQFRYKCLLIVIKERSIICSQIWYVDISKYARFIKQIICESLVNYL